MSAITGVLFKCVCARCGHQWSPRLYERTPARVVIRRPKQCPHCKQYEWDRPSQWKTTLTPERRAEIAARARKAVAARWAKK